MDSYQHLVPRDSPSILMLGPAPSSYTNPSLTANLICRVLFAIVANLVCLVPLRLLYHNGEFAAAMFIVVVEMQNLRNIVNALIWRNDDVESWWPGYGLCDLDPYVHNFGVSLYATCLLAVMRNLAIQVGSLRASPLSQREKQRRNIVQALIIFPLPLVQVVWTYPLTQQRYYITTLCGCSWPNARSWPYIIFIVLPPALVSLITTGYSIFIYIRFRQITKATQSALSNNPLAHVRNQRARRRLYLMVISILIPFLPIVIALAAINIHVTSPLKRFDFDAIHHHGPEDVPWNTILYLTSGELSWAYLNICYIPVITAIPIFIFFGMTKDAMNCYRVILLYLGLGKVLPRLYEEYNPDSRALASISNGGSSSYTTSTGLSKKNTTSSNLITGIASNQAASSAHQQPPPPTSLPVHSQDFHVQTPHRNPFPFRTRLNFSLPFKLSLFKLPEDNISSTPLEPLSHQPTPRSVWSDEESRLFIPYPATATASDTRHTPSSNDNDNDNSEKDCPAVTVLPPVLLFDTATHQTSGQGEH